MEIHFSQLGLSVCNFIREIHILGLLVFHFVFNITKINGNFKFCFMKKSQIHLKAQYKSSYNVICLFGCCFVVKFFCEIQKNREKTHVNSNIQNSLNVPDLGNEKNRMKWQCSTLSLDH